MALILRCGRTLCLAILCVLYAELSRPVDCWTLAVLTSIIAITTSHTHTRTVFRTGYCKTQYLSCTLYFTNFETSATSQKQLWPITQPYSHKLIISILHWVVGDCHPHISMCVVLCQLPDRESILGPLQHVMETRLDVMKKVSQLQGRLNLIFAQVTTAAFF